MARSVWLILGMSIVLFLGAAGPMLSSYVATSPKCPWRYVGSITVQQAYPDVDVRDYNEVTTIVDANCVLWLDIPNTVNYAQFRFTTTADGDSTTVAILVAAGDYIYNSTTYDDFACGATVVLTGGTQYADGTDVYCDTAVVTDGVLDMTALDSGNDRIAIVEGDMKAFRHVAIVATTLAVKSTLKVYVRWL